MAKKKNLLLSTSILGVTAVAFSMSPAMADGENDLLYTVDETGQTVSLNSDELSGLGLATGTFTVDAQDENLVVEDITDEEGTVTGQTTVYTVEEQGVWTFETDSEGNLVSVDFEPAEGFTGDPVVDYAINTETLGSITLDYPQVEEEVVEEEATEETTDEEATEEETTEEVAESDENEEAEEAEETEEATEEAEESAPAVSARSLAAAPAEAPTEGVLAASGVAPAEAAPAEDLADPFDVPNLEATGTNDGVISLSFGENGDELPSDVDTSTLKLVVPADDADSQVLNNGQEVNSPAGTWAVDGEGFTYTPNSGTTGTVTMEYNVMDNEGTFSNRGTLTVTVEAPAAGSNDSTDDSGSDSADTDDSTGSGSDDSTSDSGSTSDDSTNDDDSTTGSDSDDTSYSSSDSDDDSSSVNGAVAETGASVDEGANNPLYAAGAAIATAIGGFFLFLSRKSSALVKK